MYPLGWLCRGKRWRRANACHRVARYESTLRFIRSGRSQSLSWLHKGLVSRNRGDSIRTGDDSKTKYASREGFSVLKEALRLSPESVRGEHPIQLPHRKRMGGSDKAMRAALLGRRRLSGRSI